MALVRVAFVASIVLGVSFATGDALAQSATTQLANTPSPQGQLVSPDYRLGSGDHVRITVYGEQDLTGEYIVDGSGDLSFPLIGRLHAGGLTADELTHQLEAKLSPDYIKNPHLAVEVLTYRPFYIVGEVKTPGSYPYVSGMTVLNAIALAGGFTYRAREDSFYVTRNGANGDKSKIDANANSPIQPGDIVTVRERYF